MMFQTEWLEGRREPGWCFIICLSHVSCSELQGFHCSTWMDIKVLWRWITLLILHIHAQIISHNQDIKLWKYEKMPSSVFSLPQVLLGLLMLPVWNIYSESPPSFHSAHWFLKLFYPHTKIQIMTQTWHRLCFLWSVWVKFTLRCV